MLRNPEGAPRTPAVIELTVPPGGSPPRHVHHELEDSFLLLDGEMVVRCAEQTIVAKPGTYVVVPLGVEHTFRVTSPGPARMLLVHGDESFLQLIEAAGTPTRELRLPPEGEFDVDLETLVRLNEEHDSHIVGPSLEESEARAFLADNHDEAGPADVGPRPGQPHLVGRHRRRAQRAVVRAILRPRADRRGGFRRWRTHTRC